MLASNKAYQLLFFRMATLGLGNAVARPLKWCTITNRGMRTNVEKFFADQN